jgi:hypothetical protein
MLVPDTFAGAPPPSGVRSDNPFTVSSSFFRAWSSGASGDDFMAGSSLSQTMFRTDCMSFTLLVMTITASCSGSTMQYCPNAPSPR